MLKLSLGDTQRILCLGAHPDDIEIGCGGSLLTLLNENRRIEVRWVVFSATESRANEAQQSADRFLKLAEQSEIDIVEFRDRYFPYEGETLKNRVHQIADEFSPDVVFTHRRDDFHQDHRLLAELTWNAFRDHFILEYEIPKYEGDLGQPNVFVPLSQEVAQLKIDTIMDTHRTQQSKPWFDPRTFWSLMRIRGVECRSETGLAEAFHARKVVLGREA